MNRFTLIYKYLKNDRLCDYQDILEYALSRHYKVSSVVESLDLMETEKILVLRHDIDRLSRGTLGMGHIEKHLGVHATYYFRWETFEPALINQLVQMGHECSLHYETFATFVTEYGLDPKIDEVDDVIISMCQQRLMQEVELFRANTDRRGVRLPVETIASHGSSVNGAFKFPNNMLVTPDLYEPLGIRVEAYDPEYLACFDEYVSDTSLYFNGGWKYGVSPIGAMQGGKQAILFLSHPNHWHLDARRMFKRLKTAVYHGPVIQTKRFSYQHLLRKEGSG